ncbi:glutamate--tRNA ligase [Trichinella spiralis]|uniref:glutamate--tRNA ligase n=1 Tax=Trichinella spiralis TaxID=6334 RepID=UPI0001EFCC95|nr:glutamate--tRNA ligase [Trichinella spiralis]
MSDLRLVLNCGGSMRLVFEGRGYKLKYTEVTSVINEKHHIETCQVYEHLTYKMKKAVLKKSFPAIYDKEASARLREQRQVQEMLHQFTTAKLGEEDYITEVYLRKT